MFFFTVLRIVSLKIALSRAGLLTSSMLVSSWSGLLDPSTTQSPAPPSSLEWWYSHLIHATTNRLSPYVLFSRSRFFSITPYIFAVVIFVCKISVLFSFRNELHPPFLPYFDTIHTICEIFTLFILFVGVPKLKKINEI